MFNTVLIANRGVIACRIIRTLRQMGVRSVAVYSEADAGSLHVNAADQAICIGAAPPQQSYLDMDAILAAARASGAEAIHPGYGFLSENAVFAERCAAAGIAFIGPTPGQIRDFGMKHTARALAQAQQVPLVPGSGLLPDLEAARTAARTLGYPLMLKATAGGGGIGMSICEDEAGLDAAFQRVSRLAASNFADAGVFLERYVARARHVEVQVVGDGQGRVVALGERDCSLQRRHQKVIEETPAPGLSAATRAAMHACAVKLAAAVSYRSAGTVEFLYDPERDSFHFLEVNTRLQVEHGVTEQVTGIDLVAWMVRIAAGDLSDFEQPVPSPAGASIQVRLYAEDPARDFLPCSGRLTGVEFPADARVETWVAAGSEISPWYDPMLAKLIVTASDRPAAVAKLQAALAATRLDGFDTNLDWLRSIVAQEFFRQGDVSTQALDHLPWQPSGIRVLAGGLATTLQDLPGRVGYWHVGVPPSGPMDGRSFALGNRLLGNPPEAAGLEITAVGPRLQFLEAATICLTGADFGAELDGVALATQRVHAVCAGQTLSMGRVRGAGLRAYLLVAGGFDVPQYLGSRSTFALGALGGHGGRALAAGDSLRIGASAPLASPGPGALAEEAPELVHDWTLEVWYGPHGAPEFFTDEDIRLLEEAHWQVHHDSSRTGVRLMGPRPSWARRDGGEAGLHPSNIHDNPYAVGAVDFTGDMPILLGPDGPSLGGFVCPFVVSRADLWKLGQLAPGDRIRFRCIDPADGRRSWLERLPAQSGRPEVVYRRQGDSNVLVEYGPLMLDLELRLRIHALMLALAADPPPGTIDITPGIRSLQIHFDPDVVPLRTVLDHLLACENRLGSLDDLEIPSRTVYLPLSWEDPAVAETIRRYEGSVRDDAPWCPDNIEFIRRVNGLDSADAVHDTVFSANYLVLGLGDVYLGAPVAVPMDPRHRLVTTKYNPARTWTPPNVVGIGGAYLCIYGMEGPGGYQLFGRTLQVWNTWCRGANFAAGQPWLLRFFDQLRFFPVSHEELLTWRQDFEHGRRPLRIEEGTFRLADYRRLLANEAATIQAFQQQREAAFAAERADWERKGEFARAEALAGQGAGTGVAELVPLAADRTRIESPLGGVVWQVRVREGDVVAAGAPLMVIEAMKMQCEIPSPAAGIVRALHVGEGSPLRAGQPLLDLEIEPRKP